MPTQLSLDVSYPLLTRLLSPIETCLGSKYPCDLAPLYSLSHLQSPSPSAHTQLSAKLWFTPTHPLSTIPREARVSCVIGVSNELPPLHPVYPLCLCMCAVWRWATPLGMHGGISCSDQRDKEREQRLRETRARPGESRNNLATETTTRHSQRAADGSAVSTVTKTERLVHSSKRLSRAWGSGRAQGNSLYLSHASLSLCCPSRRWHTDGPHHHCGVKFREALGE